MRRRRLEVVHEAGPIEHVEADEAEGEDDPGDGVDLTDAHRAVLGDVLVVPVLAVTAQTVQEHHPAAVVPRRRPLVAGRRQQARVAVDVSGD